VLLDRIEKNIYPFVILGLTSGYVAVYKEKLQSLEWLQSILSIMAIQPNWGALSLDLFSEHVAPTTLSVVIVFLTLFVILHRIFFGEVSELTSWFGKKVIIPFENFGVLISIAMLGLILGLAIAALTTYHLTYAVTFLLLSLFPLAILLLIKCTLGFCRNSELRFVWRDDEKKHKWKSRIQGVLVLAIMVLIMIGQRYVFMFLEYLKGFVLDLIF